MRAHTKLQSLVTAAILAAAITIMTAFLFHVPIGATGGYVHFGDALIYLSAALLTAPMWMPATVVIKSLVVLPFSSRGERLLTRRNAAATLLAGAITVVGYYLAEGLLFGGWAAFLMSVTGNLVQAVGSAVLFLARAGVLDRVDLKQRLYVSLQPCVHGIRELGNGAREGRSGIPGPRFTNMCPSSPLPFLLEIFFPSLLTREGHCVYTVYAGYIQYSISR